MDILRLKSLARACSLLVYDIPYFEITHGAVIFVLLLARELFKPSKDSASLLVCNGKKLSKITKIWVKNIDNFYPNLGHLATMLEPEMLES